MHKKYCLVITDDFSRFTWVFFLATNDETSRILKNFITEIENLVEKKVKIIRCDNETEFKNRVMDEFCEEKSIKREYSVARTPQQNRVAERRKKTLIEAARTMVLVVKPHFKTAYELFKGRSHALSFMKPFGCHVIILNTLEQLGKFDGKSDEGIFVGYSTTSKAFRVYNIRTRKVEENMHITFLENKPMIADTNSNDFVCKGASFDAGQSSIEIGSSQNYILMPLWKENSLFDSSSQASDGHSKDKHGPSQVSESDHQERTNAKSSTKTINTAGPVNTATPTYADYPNDPLMPDLEDYRDEGVETDYNNLEIVISVEAMQEELLQFKLLNVWTLVDLPYGKKATGTKWVYRNKKDQRGIIVRNKE
nr:retrovirus-related Pol polyprotein from transposon TNT 1-94 [Tanacetum cinerariifolium]